MTLRRGKRRSGTGGLQVWPGAFCLGEALAPQRRSPGSGVARRTLSGTALAHEQAMEKLRDVMSRDVQVIGPDETIQEAAQQMRKGNFGMMPVGEKDRMIGAISDRDIALRAVAEGKGSGTKVRDVMSEGIVWAFEEDSVDRAVKLMSEHQIRRLPIVNTEKRLVGIVALGDFAVQPSDIEAAGQALSKISKQA